MLTLLTKYLLRYKRVCIPNVGTFEIVMLPSQLDVVNKLVSSPAYVTRYKKEDELTEHQLHFFAKESALKENSGEELFFFGEKLKRKIQGSSFHWKGFGTLQCISTEIEFEPDRTKMETLPPISAEKVLRKNVQHHVLVGDREMTSSQVTEVLNHVENKRPWFIIVGWILLILSVTAIVIYLYMKNFQTNSTGLGTW